MTTTDRLGRRLALACALGLALAPSLARAGGDQFRRWTQDMTYTCIDTGSGVDVQLDKQSVEFGNLPADAEYVNHYIDNGVDTPSGPFVVEQTTGTKVYGAFAESFPSYPLSFVFRADTLIGGVVVYRSSLRVFCSGDSTGAPQIVNDDLGLSDGLLTGTWTGKWTCQLFDNNLADKAVSTSATLLLTQHGEDLFGQLDETSNFEGTGMLNLAKPTQARAALTECRTNPVAQSFNQVLGLSGTATPTKGRLKGTSTWFSDDHVHRAIGICKYSFKRTSTADPLVSACP